MLVMPRKTFVFDFILQKFNEVRKENKTVRIRAIMCVVPDDDDILCWSDIIVMITAGHITAPTHGKLELTAH